MAAALGATHHKNVVVCLNSARQVSGVVLEITDGELARVGDYEAQYDYRRLEVLASGDTHENIAAWG